MSINIKSVVCSYYIFIVILDLGVLGAALGSVIAAFIGAVLNVVKLFSEFRAIGLAKEKMQFCKRDTAPAFRQAVPCMIQQFIMYLSGAAVQPAVNILGTAAIASYSVCSELYSICATIFQNSSRGLSPFCAQCYGKGEFSLVSRGVGISTRQGILLSLPLMAALIVFPESVASVFLGEGASRESIDYVVLYIYLCIPFIICQVMNNLFHNFFRGVMRPELAMATTAVYTVVRIATTYALAWKLGMLGVFLGFVVPWFVECVLSIVIYFSGRWKKKTLKQGT